MILGTIKFTCELEKISILKYQLGWLPIKFHGLTYYKPEKCIDPKTTTWRLMWFTTHNMINLMSLFGIILVFFFLLDFILTWINPIRYLTTQKRVVPIFLGFSKIG